MVETRALNIFFINLDRDPDRRKSIEQQLELSDVQGERIAAIDGARLPDWAIPYFPPSRLKVGEIGCYASHLLTLQLVLERGLPHALILEDDSKFDADSIEVAEKALDCLPESWDLLHLDGSPRSHPFAFRPLTALGQGRLLVRYSRIPPSMAAYLVSANGARKLLAPRPRLVPVDHDSRMPWRWDLDVFGVERGPFRTYRYSSSINSVGGHSRMRRGFRGLVSGMRSPRSAAFNIRKLGFGWWLRCLAQNAAHKTVRTFAGATVANRTLPLGCVVRLPD